MSGYVLLSVCLHACVHVCVCMCACSQKGCEGAGGRAWARVQCPGLEEPSPPALPTAHQLCPGPTGASPAWAAVAGCRWCPCRPRACGRGRALCCTSSCTCWASGTNNPEPTGTATSASTGMRSGQVSCRAEGSATSPTAGVSHGEPGRPVALGTKPCPPPGLLWNFYLFAFWAIRGDAQDLTPGHSGINPERCGGPYGVLGIESGLTVCKALPTVLSLWLPVALL